MLWYNKGNALSKLGKYEEAIQCFDKELEINPNYAEAWHNKGYYLEYQGKHEEAIQCFDKALEINPYLEYTNYMKEETLKLLNKNK